MTIERIVTEYGDMLRFHLRHPEVDIDTVTAGCEDPEYSEILAELMQLPTAVKSVVYLYYVEGYKTAEIAQMLKISTNAVKKRLQRGREMLKLKLKGEGDRSVSLQNTEGCRCLKKGEVT